MVGEIEFKSKTQGAGETLAILNNAGDLLFGPTGCKNYIAEVYALVHCGDKITKRRHVSSQIKGKAREDCAPFVLYCSNNTREQNSKKFRSIINDVERRLKVVGRTSVMVPPIDEKAITGPFIAIAPLWWTRTPILISFYTLMLRLSLRMRLGESFDEFRARIIKAKDPHKDVMQFKAIDKNGNLDGILARALPCMARKSYADHLLTQHDRGVVDYDAKKDAEIPMGFEEILVWRKKVNYDNYNGIYGSD